MACKHYHIISKNNQILLIIFVKIRNHAKISKANFMLNLNTILSLIKYNLFWNINLIIEIY